MPSDRLLTVKEAAERLRVDPKTVYRWCWSRELPHVRLGAKEDVLRIPESTLEKYIHERLTQGW